MPREKSHLELANHNQEFLDTLVPQVERFPDWVATVAFYKAVHIVEAVFACERVGSLHSSDHMARNHRLKTTPRYEKINEHYRVLYSASILSRYMRDDEAVFVDQYKPDQVIGELLNHSLRQIEKSAAKFLNHADLLVHYGSNVTLSGESAGSK